MSVSPQYSHVECLIPCDDVRRWGLWEVLRSGGETLINGISALRRGVQRTSFLSLTTWGHNEEAICSPEESSRSDPAMLGHWSQTSSL